MLVAAKPLNANRPTGVKEGLCLKLVGVAEKRRKGIKKYLADLYNHRRFAHRIGGRNGQS